MLKNYFHCLGHRRLVLYADWIMLLKWMRHSASELHAERNRWVGMTTPKKRSKKNIAVQELDDRWVWVVIGLIVGGVTLVLWLPLLKQFVG